MKQFKLYLQWSGEAETSTGGDQLVRNSLSDWNGLGAEHRPLILNHSKKLFLKKLISNLTP
jgi:hypothetical protein